MEWKCDNDQWFTEDYGFFGEFYYISDNSSEGPYAKKSSTRDERTEAEVSLIKNLLGVKEGERLFDWPCGWGRHSLRLAEEGLKVTSLDINTYHLDKLKKALEGKTEEVQERVEIKKQDLRHSLNRERQYDYGINMFSSFGFFGDDENLQVLQNFYDLLKPGGKLLIHLDFNAGRVIYGDNNDYAASRNIRFNGQDYSLKVEKKYCYEDKRLHGRWELTEKNEVKEYSFRIYSEAEWVELLERVGFIGVQFFNGQGELQTPQDIDTVILAKKPIDQTYIKSDLDKVAQNIINKVPTAGSVRDVFFEELKSWWEKEVDTKNQRPWLKYINILNREDAGFFVSTLFDEPLITHDRDDLRERMDNAEVIGSAHSIGAVLRDQGVYSEIYELIVDKQKTHFLGSWIDIYSWIRPKESGGHTISQPLRELLKSSNITGEELNSWTTGLTSAYTGRADEISHFFYLTGPTSFNVIDGVGDEFRYYIVRANVGVKLTDGLDIASLSKDELNEEISKRKREVEVLLKGLQAFVDKMTVFFVTRKLNQDILRQASRAAIAQAFARNKSHNLGSHVLTHCTKSGAFANQGEVLLNRADAYQGAGELTPKDSSSDAQYFFATQLATFFSYIANRDSYISESTYDVSNFLATRYAYRDLFVELDKNRILLNHISGLSNFRYKFTFRYSGKGLREGNDIPIAFPGDALGMQAFYNILENLVRNTAKHNGNKGKEEVVDFTVDFRTIDNEPKLSEYYCVEVSDNIMQEGITGIVKGLRGKINDSILDSRTQGLRSHSLGLLEMEASAAFLRQVDLPDIENDMYNNAEESLGAIDKDYILQAFAKDINKEGKGILAYRFYVKKPKMYLIITSRKIDEKCKTQGVDIITPKDFVDSLAKGKYYHHEFAIWGKDDYEGVKEAERTIFNFFKEKHDPKRLRLSQEGSSEAPNDTQEDLDKLSLLPHRLMKVDSDFIEKNLSGRDAAITSLEEAVWSQWIRETYGIFNSLNDQCPAPQIVLFDHLYAGNMELWTGLQEFMNHGRVVYGEILSSNAQKKLPGFREKLSRYCLGLRNYPSSKNKLWEAYDTCVLAIDERIQDFAEKNYGSLTIQEKAILRLSNVIIPDKKECDLAAEVYIPELVTKIEGFINDSLSRIDFLLIHYGILERMYPVGDAKKQKMWEWSKGTKVIVTTGRGKHSLSLPETVSYVNLPTVLNAFVDNRNKYTINHILNQARR